MSDPIWGKSNDHWAIYYPGRDAYKAYMDGEIFLFDDQDNAQDSTAWDREALMKAGVPEKYYPQVVRVRETHSIRRIDDAD